MGLLKSQKVNLVRARGNLSILIRCKWKAKGKRKPSARKPWSWPRVPSILASRIPFDGKEILSSDDIFLLTEPPRELIIIGEELSGLSCYDFQQPGDQGDSFGNAPQIISTEEPEVIQGLHRLLEKDGIRILTQAKVLRALPVPGRSGYFAEGRQGGRAFRREDFDGGGAETEYGGLGFG